MTKDELMQALLVERYTSPWWETKADEYDDSELTCARRRRVLDDAVREVEKRGAA